MNKHITENLSYYLTLDKPEYAVLLSGKWGSGKTFFIDTFVENYNATEPGPEKEKKFIKISLFGLKEVTAIDEQIFQNLHPVLGSKYAKLTGNILKSAFKLGVNLDFDEDGKKDGSLTTSLEKFNPLELFSAKSKNNREIIFIFDDIERTDISIKEVLGYINYLVELAGFKVILIANEDKLLEDEQNIYLDFKEKVVGKTFEVRHHFPDILDKFLVDEPVDIIGFDRKIIDNVYTIANYKNLRHVKQSLIDFKYIIEKIDIKYLENIDFFTKLTYVFFALSVEAKHGALDRDEFSSFNRLVEALPSDSTTKEESSIGKTLKKYNLGSGFILPRPIWIQILYKSHIEGGMLNEAVSNLSFFLEEKENEKPSWVKLWNYRELEDEEFVSVLTDVIDKFKSCTYSTPELQLHAAALLIFFYKKNLSTLSIDEIKKHIENCAENYRESSRWKSSQLTNDIAFNGTGFVYMNDHDPDFREMFSLVKTISNKIYQDTQEIEKNKSLKVFLNAIKDNDQESVKNFLLNENEFSPVLSGLNSQDFFNSLKGASNKALSELFKIFSYRYSDNKTLNGRGYGFYLNEEDEFWKETKDIFDNFDYPETVRGLILKQFKEYLVDIIFGEMNKNQH